MASQRQDKNLGDFYRLPNESIYDSLVLNIKAIKPKTIDKIKKMDTSEKDIILTSYPRSGSTWTSAIIHGLMFPEQHAIGKNTWNKNVRLLELTMPYDILTSTLKLYGKPRLLKTHLHARHIKKQIDDGKAKIIVVMRNPKDCLVSYYHFYRLNKVFGDFTGSFQDFFELFKRKHLMYGDWLEYNREFWKIRNNPRVLILFYEDMVKDLEAAIVKIACFMDLSPSKEQIRKLYSRVSFKAMKENPSYEVIRHKIEEDAFYRKGKVGSWTEVLTEEQSKYIDTVYGDVIKRLNLPISYGGHSKL